MNSSTPKFQEEFDKTCLTVVVCGYEREPVFDLRVLLLWLFLLRHRLYAGSNRHAYPIVAFEMKMESVGFQPHALFIFKKMEDL